MFEQEEEWVSKTRMKKQMNDLQDLCMELEAFLAKLRGDNAAHNAFLQRIEQARDRLLADDGAVTQFMADFPHADAGKLRTLIRNTKKEQEQNKPPKNFRALFQEIKAVMEGSRAEGADGVQDWAE